MSASVFAVVMAWGCHGDHRANGSPPPVPPPPVIDTVPQDLSGTHTALPPAVADTFTPRPSKRTATSPASAATNYPPAPDALMDAVKREQSVTRFCYQEYGQKADPMLRGQVALVVTAAGNAISGISIAQSNWSSPDAGGPVNDCLVSRAKQAWRLDPGTNLTPGTYLVQLNFRGGGN